MLPKPKCGWWVEEPKRRNEKGAENGKAADVFKYGTDLEFSGTRRENVLSKTFQSTVATNNPDVSLWVVPGVRLHPNQLVAAMGWLLCTYAHPSFGN